ncbi:MAG: hypothetical protein SFX73_00530 [Kofleriaceae bacterium]|nr:hypothetical protein [Kofleriaceae bacterium]
MGENAREARESVSDAARRAQDRAGEFARGAGDQARRIRRRSSDLYRANPIAVGTALLATGTIIGLALPRTRLEDDLIGDKRDDVVDKGKELAHQALGKASEKVKNLGGDEESQRVTKPGDDFH